MSQQDYEILRGFLEDRDVSIRAAKPLKDGTVLLMQIVDDPESYYIMREKKKTYLKQGQPPKDPQISFIISPGAIKRLNDFQTDSIGEFGVEFFKIMVSDDPELTLEARLNTGFLGLTRIGVFGILASGGPSVMAFLARKGLRSLKEIRKTIAKMRGE